MTGSSGSCGVEKRQRDQLRFASCCWRVRCASSAGSRAEQRVMGAEGTDEELRSGAVGVSPKLAPSSVSTSRQASADRDCRPSPWLLQ